MPAILDRHQPLGQVDSAFIKRQIGQMRTALSSYREPSICVWHAYRPQILPIKSVRCIRIAAANHIQVCYLPHPECTCKTRIKTDFSISSVRLNGTQFTRKPILAQLCRRFYLVPI